MAIQPWTHFYLHSYSKKCLFLRLKTAKNTHKSKSRKQIKTINHSLQICFMKELSLCFWARFSHQGQGFCSFFSTVTSKDFSNMILHSHFTPLQARAENEGKHIIISPFVYVHKIYLNLSNFYIHTLQLLVINMIIKKTFLVQKDYCDYKPNHIKCYILLLK